MLSNPLVLFVTNSLSGGGAERAANVIVNALWSKGTNVALCTINSGGQDSVKPRCPIFQINRDPKSGVYSTFIAYIRFRQMLRRSKPQVVVFGCELPELFAAFSKGSFQKVVILHTSAPWIGRRMLGKFVRYLLASQKVTWVSVSEHLSVWGVNVKEQIVIPNPVNFDFRETRESPSGKIKRFVFIGRLSEEKQPKWILELSKITKIPCLLIGSGYLSPELQLFSAVNSIEADFYGYLEDPWKSVLSGDLLIIPSRFEGDCLVLLEAVSKNIPFQLNDIIDLRRFEFDDNFYFKSPHDLSEKLKKRNFDLGELTISSEIRTRMINKRHPDLIVGKWENLLSNLGDAFDAR